MKQIARAIAALMLLCCNSYALEINIHLEHANVDISDQQSIERGAKSFKQQCLACHSLRYLDYNAVATTAGITLDTMPLNIQNWTFAKAPPDLSLVTKTRGPNWVYTYLISYYQDDNSVHGSNNLLVPNTSMPNPFVAQQGVQILADPDDLRSEQIPRAHNLLLLKSKGSLSPKEFEQHLHDLVNFLNYASEPTQQKRKKLAPWVLLFLLGFSGLAFALKQSFWKDVK